MNARSHRDARRRPAGGRPTRRRPALPLLRHSLVLAKRSLIKTWRTPEALIDVTLQPIIFLLLFTYVFGGAIAHGSQHAATCSSCCPGCSARPSRWPASRSGPEPQRRHREGRLRPVPSAADRPVGALVGAVAGRLRPLPDPVRRHPGLRLHHGLPGPHQRRSPRSPRSRCRSAFALCFCWISVFVGMIARTPGAVQGIMFLIVLPLTFGSNTFVQTSTMPGWLQAFVKVNPITQLVSAVRGLMIGGPVATTCCGLAWMAVLLVVFVPLALRAYRRRA